MPGLVVLVRKNQQLFNPNKRIRHRNRLTGELREFARDLILDPVTRNRTFYDSAALEDVMQRHFAGKAHFTPEIVKIGNIELWGRQNDI